MVGVQEVVFDAGAWVWTIKIRGGTHNDDTGEVDDLEEGGTEKGAEGSVVLLSGHAVDSGPVGEEAGGIFERFTEECS